MSNSVLGCRRRQTQRRSSVPLSRASPASLPPMAPRSFEHQIYITLVRTGYRLAYIIRGLLSYVMVHLGGISNFCALYSFTGFVFTAFVGSMIKHQPLFIKGIDDQELAKENAFGAMGMFMFIFCSSALYIFFHKRHDEDHAIMSQGFMRPHLQAGGTRLSDYEVELQLPLSVSPPSRLDSDEIDEFTPVLLT